MENKKEKIEDMDITQLLHSAMIQITDKFDSPPEVLYVGDSVIGTLGNFSASTGKAKSKKTFNVSAIVASALVNGTILQYRANLPPEKRTILYIDTEQSKYHCQKVLDRILRLAGLPTDEKAEGIIFISLRKFTPQQRIAVTEEAIYTTKFLGLVIIDGIRDLAYDINSPSEATSLITKLMQWTDEQHIHIHTVLHQNKGDDNSRGHIGTELNNKAETILQVAKDSYDKDVSIVSSVHIRAIEFDKFAFRINDNALPELVDDYEPERTTSKRGFDYKELTEQQHRDALNEAFKESKEFGYTELIQALKLGYESIGYSYGRNKITDLKVFLCNKRMVVQQGKKYCYDPNFTY